MIKRFPKALLIVSVLSILSMLAVPVHADIPPVGVRVIPMFNYIRNIGDFPDYRFIGADLRFAEIEFFWEIGFVADDGAIPSPFKYLQDSIFAVPKTAINTTDLGLREMSGSEFSAFLRSCGAREVARGIYGSKAVSILSMEESITNYYDVDLGRTLEGPTRTVVSYNELPYFYLALSVVGLAGIAAVHVKRRRK